LKNDLFFRDSISACRLGCGFYGVIQKRFRRPSEKSWVQT
jgi:hypothetical protein